MPAWVVLVAPCASTCALGVLGFAYAVLLLPRLGLHGEDFELALYVLGALLLAPLCVAGQLFLIRPDFRSSATGPVEAVNCWAASALLIGLAALPIIMHFGSFEADFWPQNAKRVVVAVAALHCLGLAAAIALHARLAPSPHLPAPLTSRHAQVAGLSLALMLAGFALFSIDPSNRYLNLFIRLFFEPPFSDEPGVFGPGRAFVMAVAAIAAVAAALKFEAALARRGASRLRTVRSIALCCAVPATIVLLFDFSLAHDAFHYLTNVGPALHILHGGTPMVDAFSQYGPGPVLATALAFLVGPTTFGTAQVMVQLFNFAFYALWLVCLYRMTRWKLAGLLLGILSIALYMAAWGRGYANVSDAPSVLGFRYLPTLAMVLALSCLRVPARHSALTALSTFFSGLWSVETLVGTLGIHFAFLGLLGLRDRAIVRAIGDGIAALLPAAAAVLVMTIATLLVAGAPPDYGTYLGLLAIHHPLEGEPWSVAVNPMFLGWSGMLLAMFVVMSDAWARVLNPPSGLMGVGGDAVFYRFVPMTMLLMLQAAYFVGRSVDYNLAMALLPFCALAIPAALAVTTTVSTAAGPARLLTLVPAAIGLWIVTFTGVSLLRQNAPYSLFVHECRDHGRCSPAGLARGFDEAIRLRAVLEQVRKPDPDGWLDSDGIVRDAVTMIGSLAPDERAVTVLLGRLRRFLTLSEFALMYAGKWDRWPRSMTFSDELLKPLAERIVAAPIRLREGELVIVRSDETALGVIETGILQRIRSEYRLCPLPHASKLVAAYRIAGPSGCPPA